MSKLKIFTVIIAVLAVAAIVILRAQYGGEEITDEEFAINGLRNGIALEAGSTLDEIYVSVPDHLEIEDVISISSAPDVAYLCLDKDAAADTRVISCEVIGVSPGIAELYIRSGDGENVSRKYTVNVIANSTEITRLETHLSEDTDDENENTVYLTRSGSKYHLSKKCAGESCYGTELEDAVEKGYLPCKNCAMK